MITNYFKKEKYYFMAKKSDGNSDTNAVNETSNAANKTRGELDHRHPRADEETLKQSEHYVSLKKIKEDGDKNGVTSYKPEKGADKEGVKAEKKSGDKKSTKKPAKKEKQLNDKKRPEPTPELEKKTPGAREI